MRITVAKNGTFWCKKKRALYARLAEMRPLPEQQCEMKRSSLRLGHQIYRRRKEAPVRALEFFSDCCIWSIRAFLGRGNTPRSIWDAIRMRHIKGHTSSFGSHHAMWMQHSVMNKPGPQIRLYCAVCNSTGQFTFLNMYSESVRCLSAKDKTHTSIYHIKKWSALVVNLFIFVPIPTYIGEMFQTIMPSWALKRVQMQWAMCPPPQKTTTKEQEGIIWNTGAWKPFVKSFSFTSGQFVKASFYPLC